MAAETAAAADFGSALHGMLGFAFLGDALFWGLLACLSVPHWLYAWVWTRPEAWKRLVASVFGANGRHPVDAFAATATLLKLFQFSAVLVWYAQRGPFEVPALWQVAIGSVLFVFGQILNVSIYTAIGTDGVYYGIKLGRPVCAGAGEGKGLHDGRTAVRAALAAAPCVKFPPHGPHSSSRRLGCSKDTRSSAHRLRLTSPTGAVVHVLPVQRLQPPAVSGVGVHHSGHCGAGCHTAAHCQRRLCLGGHLVLLLHRLRLCGGQLWRSSVPEGQVDSGQ